MILSYDANPDGIFGKDRVLSKARLIAEHGADISPELRHVLAACPRRGQMHDPCEAVFPDLVK
jgi:hypothetical protein